MDVIQGMQAGHVDVRGRMCGRGRQGKACWCLHVLLLLLVVILGLVVLLMVMMLVMLVVRRRRWEMAQLLVQPRQMAGSRLGHHGRRPRQDDGQRGRRPGVDDARQLDIVPGRRGRRRRAVALGPPVVRRQGRRRAMVVRPGAEDRDRHHLGRAARRRRR